MKGQVFTLTSCLGTERQSFRFSTAEKAINLLGRGNTRSICKPFLMCLPRRGPCYSSTTYSALKAICARNNTNERETFNQTERSRNADYKDNETFLIHFPSFLQSSPPPYLLLPPMRHGARPMLSFDIFFTLLKCHFQECYRIVKHERHHYYFFVPVSDAFQVTGKNSADTHQNTSFV